MKHCSLVTLPVVRVYLGSIRIMFVKAKLRKYCVKWQQDKPRMVGSMSGWWKWGISTETDVDWFRIATIRYAWLQKQPLKTLEFRSLVAQNDRTSSQNLLEKSPGSRMTAIWMKWNSGEDLQYIVIEKGSFLWSERKGKRRDGSLQICRGFRKAPLSVLRLWFVKVFSYCFAQLYKMWITQPRW